MGKLGKKSEPIIGEHKSYQIVDSRGVRYSPFNLSPTTPMINPVSWQLINNWEDGFYIYDNILQGMARQTLIQVVNGEIVEGYRLEKLEKGKDLIY
jgi:hypothetical protein